MENKFTDYPIPEDVRLASIAEANKTKKLVEETIKSIEMRDAELANLLAAEVIAATNRNDSLN